MAKRTAKKIEKFIEIFKDWEPLDGKIGTADEWDDGTGTYPDTGEDMDPYFGWDRMFFILLNEDGELQVETDEGVDIFPFTRAGVAEAKEAIEEAMRSEME